MAETLFYLDKYADEVLPLGLERPTLEGWAAWLSRGGERNDGRQDRDSCWCFDPPAGGTEYAAGSLAFEDDVIATRSDDGESIAYSRPIPDDIDFVAIRFGPGMGWEGDSIMSPEDVEAQLLDKDCPMLEPGESGHLAIARNANLRLIYRTAPPRLEVLGTVQ